MNSTGGFGALLKHCRQSAGFSQRELAYRSGLDFSYISKLENGRVPPPAADTVVTLSQVLGVAAEGLLALTCKIPSEVQATVSSSPTAQRFLIEAREMELTEREWGRLVKSLRLLRTSR